MQRFVAADVVEQALFLFLCFLCMLRGERLIESILVLFSIYFFAFWVWCVSRGAGTILVVVASKY